RRLLRGSEMRITARSTERPYNEAPKATLTPPLPRGGILPPAEKCRIPPPRRRDAPWSVRKNN
ncbi:MAG: hypothetical protein K2I51_02395, partial [Muribaculaceae bacterium]|nr:hypothetical protein [Muribaculaceae bacterium]